MSIVDRLKPKFWDYRPVAAETDGHLFDFRRMWKLAAFLTAAVSIIPLVFLSALNYHVTQSSIES
ncbi:MAG: two-component sensor histidine kinase, partial [Desulfobacteraceae bacterium]|nr:two-component sensor histidine kinase [Desulfobacteraceae bacterium]